MKTTALVPSFAVLVASALFAAPAAAQCTETPLLNYTGGGQIVCPCFVPGEQAGVVLEAPAGDYPIEITKIRIGWSSQFGGAPTSLEGSLNLYGAGLPNPGTPQFSVAGPALTDGFVNEFDISGFPGNRVITGGPFTVTLGFANSNAGDIFAPSVVHDGNGCQNGKNVIFATPGGWLNSCSAGLTGDWVMEVSYLKLAKAEPFNGSGVNPNTLSGVGAPVLGSTWGVSLDCSGWSPSVGAVFGYTQPAVAPIGLAIGELLIDPASAQQILQTMPHGGGVALFNFNIPSDPAICGGELFMQGACFGAPGTQLTNRLDLRAGN